MTPLPLDHLLTDVVYLFQIESLLWYHVVPFLVGQDLLSRLLELAIVVRVAKSPHLHLWIFPTFLISQIGYKAWVTSLPVCLGSLARSSPHGL
jgi:hypothetical protein